MANVSKQIASLSPEKLSLLAERLKRRDGAGSKSQVIESRNSLGPSPLSFAQEGLWFITQLEPSSYIYNTSGAIRVQGALNIGALSHTLGEIIRRHQILRTKFLVINGRPAQVVEPSRAITLPVVDLTALDEKDKEEQARRLSEQESQRPFILSVGPMIRTSIIRLSENDHVILQTAHHIVCDGWSRSIYHDEVQKFYKAFSRGVPSLLPELPIQYIDFAVWQRGYLQGEVLESQLAYWRKQLEGAPPVLKLVLAHRNAKVARSLSSKESFALPTALTNSLRALGNRERVSLFMILLAAFKVLIYRYSGQEDIVVGTAIANRNRRETEALMGLFINMLALRTKLSGNPSFRDLLQRVREVTLGAYAHKDVPFEKLIDTLHIKRELRHRPLFQAVFVLNNVQTSEVNLPGLGMTPINATGAVNHYDLHLAMLDTGQRLTGSLEYNASLFEADMVRQMLKHLEAILEVVAVHPERRLLDLRLPINSKQSLLQSSSEAQDRYRREEFSF